MAQVCFPGKSMDKKDWYKLLAVGIVLIFVIEGIAIGILQDDTPSGGGSGTATESLTGTVNTNVTIVRYEPYVIVGGGNQDEVENAKQRLIESGAATYAVPKDENLVVSLRSGKDAPTAAMEFEKANATVLATAMISTPSRLRVDAQDISTTVDGTSFNIQLRPIFDEGSVAAATFVAVVENGVLSQLGNFVILPSYVQGATAQAILVAEKEADFSVEVPWEDRSAAKPIAIAEGAAYKEKSYIIVQQNATSAQLSALSTAGKDYITGAQAGIVSVRNGYENRSRAEADLLAAGLEMEFPASLATFGNQSENRSLSLVEKLNASGISAKTVSRKTSTARLPDFVEKDGRKYRTNGIVATFEQTGEALNGSVLLSLDFQAEGSFVSRLVSVRQVPLPSAG